MASNTVYFDAIADFSQVVRESRKAKRALKDLEDANDNLTDSTKENEKATRKQTDAMESADKQAKKSTYLQFLRKNANAQRQEAKQYGQSVDEYKKYLKQEEVARKARTRMIKREGDEARRKAQAVQQKEAEALQAHLQKMNDLQRREELAQEKHNDRLRKIDEDRLRRQAKSHRDEQIAAAKLQAELTKIKRKELDDKLQLEVEEEMYESRKAIRRKTIAEQDLANLVKATQARIDAEKKSKNQFDKLVDEEERSTLRRTQTQRKYTKDRLAMLAEEMKGMKNYIDLETGELIEKSSSHKTRPRFVTKEEDLSTPTVTVKTKDKSSFLDDLGKSLDRLQPKANTFKKWMDVVGNWRPRLFPPFIALIPIIGALLGYMGSLVALLGAVGAAAGGLAVNLGSVAGAALGISSLFTTLVSGVAAGIVAFKGFGGAVKAGFLSVMEPSVENTKAFNEALAKLSPSAQKFVKELVPLRREMENLRKNVQERFFEKIADDAKLFGKVLPYVGNNLAIVSSELGSIAHRVIELVTSDKWIKDMNQVTADSIPTFRSLGDILTDTLSLVMALAKGSSKFTQGLVEWIGKGVRSLKEMAEQAADTGKMADYLDNVLDRLKQWGRIVGNLSKTVYNFGKAMGDFGQWMTDGLENMTQSWRRASESAAKDGSKFKQTLEDYKPLLTELKSLFGDTFKWMGRQMSDATNIKQMTEFVNIIRTGLGPALGRIFDSLKESNVGNQMARTLVVIANGIADVMEAGASSGLHAFFDTLTLVTGALSGLAHALSSVGLLKPVVAILGTLAALRWTGVTKLIPALVTIGSGAVSATQGLVKFNREARLLQAIAEANGNSVSRFGASMTVMERNLKNTASSTSGFKANIAALGGTVVGFGNRVAESGTRVGQTSGIFQSSFSAMKNAASSVGAAMKSAATSVFNFISPTRSAKDAASEANASISNLSKAGSSAKSGASSAASAMTTLIGSSRSAGAAAEEASSKLSGVGKAAGEAKAGTSGIGGAMGAAASATSAAGNAADGASQKFGLLSKAGSAVKTGMSSLVGFMGGVPGVILAAVAAVVSLNAAYNASREAANEAALRNANLESVVQSTGGAYEAARTAILSNKDAQAGYAAAMGASSDAASAAAGKLGYFFDITTQGNTSTRAAKDSLIELRDGYFDLGAASRYAAKDISGWESFWTSADESQTALRQALGATGDAIAAIGERSIPRMQDALKSLSAQMGNNGYDMLSFIHQSDNLTNKLNDMISTAGINTEAFRANADAVNMSTQDYTQWQIALGNIQFTSKGTAYEVNALGQVTQFLGDQAQAQADYLSDMADSISAAGSAAMQAQAGEMGYYDALDKTQDALAKNGQSLDVHTRAGRDNLQALMNLAQSSKDYAASMLKSGMSTDEAKDSIVGAREEFIRMATAMGGGTAEAAAKAQEMADKFGLTTDAVDKTAEAMDNVPSEINTKMNLEGADETLFTIDEVTKAAIPKKVLKLESDPSDALKGIEGVEIMKVGDKDFRVFAKTKEAQEKIEEILGIKFDEKGIPITAEDKEAWKQLLALQGITIDEKGVPIATEGDDTAEGTLDKIQNIQVGDKYFGVFANTEPAWGAFNGLNGAVVADKWFGIFGNSEPAWGAFNNLQAAKVVDKWFGIFANSDPAWGAFNNLQNAKIPDKWFGIFANSSPAWGAYHNINNVRVEDKWFGIFANSSPAWGAYWDIQNARVSDKHFNIIGTRVDRHNGGVIPTRRANGGAIPQKLAVGGRTREDSGFTGEIPGHGNSDRVPVLAMPGEFMIRRQIVDRIGLDNLIKLNSGILSYGQMLQSLQAQSNPAATLQSNATASPYTLLGGSSSALSTVSIPSLSTDSKAPVTNVSSDNSVTIEKVEINNPKAEPASDSLPNTLRKIGYSRTGR